MVALKRRYSNSDNQTPKGFPKKVVCYAKDSENYQQNLDDDVENSDQDLQYRDIEKLGISDIDETED